MAPLTDTQRRDCAQAAAQLGPAGDAKIGAKAGVKPKTVARWRQQYNITTQHQPTLPTPNTRTILTQAARRQYNRRTNWIPDRFRTNRHKADLLVGHSVLEAIHGYTDQWIRLRLQNPNDHNTTKPPFSPELTELADNYPKPNRRQRKTLAKTWTGNKDHLTCTNTCLDTSTSFRNFNHALADAANIKRSLLDEAAQQAAAARTYFAQQRGEPAPTGCDAPGERPGPS